MLLVLLSWHTIGCHVCLSHSKRVDQRPMERVGNRVRLPICVRGNTWHASHTCDEPRCTAMFNETLYSHLGKILSLLFFFLVKKCCPVLTHCWHWSIRIVAVVHYKLAVTFCFCLSEILVITTASMLVGPVLQTGFYDGSVKNFSLKPNWFSCLTGLLDCKLVSYNCNRNMQVTKDKRMLKWEV